MSDLFTTRWGTLISDYDNRPYGLDLNPSVSASIVGYAGDKVVYESGRFDLNTVNIPLSPSVPSTSPAPRYWLQVEIPSLDGMTTFREQFEVVLRPSAVLISGTTAVVDFRESSVMIPGSRLVLFKPNGTLPGYTRHVLRLRAFQVRKRQWTLFVKTKRNDPHAFPGLQNEQSIFPTNSLRIVDGSTVVDTVGSITVPTRTKSVTRVLTPNFRSLRKWERPENPYEMSEVIHSTRMGYQRVQTVDQSSVTQLVDVGPTEYFTSLPAPDLTFGSEAEARAFKSLTGPTGLGGDTANLPESALTFRQTTRMIAGNALRIVSAVKSLKRGHFGDATRTLFGERAVRFRKGFRGFRPVGDKLSASSALANNWLELQYGWKPLLSDITYVIDATHRNYHPDLRTVRKAGHSDSFSSGVFTAPFNGSFATVVPYQAGTWNRQRHVRVAFNLRYTVSDQDALFMARSGFTSPVSLAWELLPFSFVVDWFLPVGPYLEALHAFSGLTFKGGTKTSFVRETIGGIISHEGIHGVNPQRVIITNRGGFQRLSVRLKREVLTTFPQAPNLQFKNPISIVHASNALALLRSVFRE